MYRLVHLTIVLATTSTAYSQFPKQPRTRVASHVAADCGIAVSKTTKGKNTKPSRKFRTLICVRDVKAGVTDARKALRVGLHFALEVVGLANACALFCRFWRFLLC